MGDAGRAFPASGSRNGSLLFNLFPAPRAGLAHHIGKDLIHESLTILGVHSGYVFVWDVQVPDVAVNGPPWFDGVLDSQVSARREWAKPNAENNSSSPPATNDTTEAMTIMEPVVPQA